MNDFLTQNQRIGRFTDKDMSAEEETLLLAQAAHNPILRNELRLDQDINDFVTDYDRIKLSEVIRRTIKNKKEKIFIPVGLKVAASIVMVITMAGLAGLLIHFSNQNHEYTLASSRPLFKLKGQGLPVSSAAYKSMTVNSTPAKRREMIQNNISNDPYTPRPEYEFLVGTVTRDISVILISPASRVICKGDSLLQFSWRWVNGCTPVNLEVTNNHGHVMLNETQITDVVYELNLKHWSRGLYYYKMSAGDELVTIGSISIY